MAFPLSSVGLETGVNGEECLDVMVHFILRDDQGMGGRRMVEAYLRTATGEGEERILRVRDGGPVTATGRRNIGRAWRLEFGKPGDS